MPSMEEILPLSFRDELNHMKFSLTSKSWQGCCMATCADGNTEGFGWQEKLLRQKEQIYKLISWFQKLRRQDLQGFLMQACD